MRLPPTAIPGRASIADLGEIELEAVVEMGRTRMSLRQARQLRVGDSIAVDRLAGEAMALTLNGHRFGEGEIVVNREQLFLRLTRLQPTVEASRQESTT